MECGVPGPGFIARRPHQALSSIATVRQMLWFLRQSQLRAKFELADIEHAGMKGVGPWMGCLLETSDSLMHSEFVV
jgi:hypothetical protein